MGKLHFAVNQEQYNALQGLAYRVADNAYMIERYGVRDTEQERQDNHKIIVDLFEKLDLLQVPFWVQNNVICYFENWRRYKTDYLYQCLESRGVDCSAVSTR